MSRAEELRAPLPHGIPLHVVQGVNDPFGTPDEVRAELPDPSVVTAVAGAHSFPRNPADAVTARWFHYGQTEARHLRRILGSAAQPLLERATDLLDEVIRPGYYAPGGYSLKHLAGRVGATWRTAGATGATPAAGTL